MIDLKLSRKLFNDVYFTYLYKYDEPLEVYYGSAGSGKSVFIAQKLLIKALNDKRKVLVIRKVGNSQKESCWRLFLELLSQWKIYKYCNIRVSDMSIELPNGSILLCKGLDDPEKIKSIVGITDVWCEEGTELTEEDFDQLILRMRAKKNDLQMFISFNPVSKASWCYKRWFSKEAVEHPFILKTTYKDNKFLPQQYIEKLENMINTNPVYYHIYALGEWASLDKLVFNNWTVQEFDHKQIKGELLCGLDFGYVNDPTAFIASILTEDTIYIFREWGDTGQTNPMIAKAIENMGFAKSLIIADSAESKSIEEIRQNGIYRIRPAEKGPDSVLHGIQKLQQYKIIVHPSCIETITEFENYAWKKDRKSGEYINTPVDAYNHYIDSLRYSLQCTKQELRTIPKSRLGL